MIGTRGLLVAVVVAAMFGAACGILGGIGVVHFVASHHPGVFRHLMHGDRPRFAPPGERFGPPFARLARDLDLSDAQRERIEADIERTRTEGRALRESLRVRIERELTAEQRARFRTIAPPLDEPSPERGPRPRPDRAAPGQEGEGSR